MLPGLRGNFDLEKVPENGFLEAYDLDQTAS
jgi:hypothetical protein